MSSEEDFTEAMLALLKELVSSEQFFLLTNQSVHQFIAQCDQQELMRAIRRVKAPHCCRRGRATPACSEPIGLVPGVHHRQPSKAEWSRS